jgi:putative sigma-54 modulation protein
VEISISTRHGQISDETREKVTNKVEKLPRFFDRISSIDVTIDLEHRETPTVDLRVLVKNREFVATSRAQELMASMDQVVDKLEQQLRKHKEKAVDRHRSGGHR